MTCIGDFMRDVWQVLVDWMLRSGRTGLADAFGDIQDGREPSNFCDDVALDGDRASSFT